MLTTDPRGIGKGSVPRMEVSVYLGREMPPDYMGRNRARELARPLTQVEDRRIKGGTPKETVVKESFCRMRPDGIEVLPPVGNKPGIFCILEHKRMSDVFERYLIRTRVRPRTSTYPSEAL